MAWMNRSAACRRLIRLCALAVCISTLAVTAEAGKLKVKVVQSIDQTPRPPLQGATVCYRKANTPGAPALGTKRTDAGGVADFGEVPEGDYDVTIVATNFKAKVERLFMRSADASPTFALAPGTDTSGITCPSAGITQPQATAVATVNIDYPPPKILSLKINDGAESATNRGLTLKATFDRTPKFYRVGETKQTSAVWTPYPAAAGGMIGFTLSDKGADNFGKRDVYLQVKTEDGKVSEVAHDSIELKPVPVLKTITGAELKELLKYAKEQGFGFDGKFIAGNNGSCRNSDQNSLPQIFGTSIDLPGVSVGIDVDNMAKIYEASFFTGRQLNPHWTMKAPAFSGGINWVPPYASYAVTKSPTGGSPSFTVQLIIAPRPTSEPQVSVLCGQVRLILKSVTLEGPRDLDWREAFKN